MHGKNARLSSSKSKLSFRILPYLTAKNSPPKLSSKEFRNKKIFQRYLRKLFSRYLIVSLTLSLRTFDQNSFFSPQTRRPPTWRPLASSTIRPKSRGSKQVIYNNTWEEEFSRLYIYSLGSAGVKTLLPTCWSFPRQTPQISMVRSDRHRLYRCD